MTAKKDTEKREVALVVREVFEGGQRVITRRIHDDYGEMPPTPIVYKIGGKQYPYRIEPKCRVCTLDPEKGFRFEIEQHILNGLGPRTIARSLPSDLEISERNISDHVHNGHMPLEQSIKRVLVEDSYEQLGKSLADAEHTLVTWLGFARAGLQQAFERLSNGQMNIGASEAIQLAQMLMQADRIMGEGASQESWLQVFDVVWQTIQDNAPPDVAQAIGRAIADNPVLNGLEQRRQRAIEAGSAEVAEGSS